jgi:WD40 repeat protein
MKLLKCGKYIVSSSYDETIKMWSSFHTDTFLQSKTSARMKDSARGELIYSIIGHNYMVVDMCLSSDDSKIISCSDNSIKVWDFHTYKLLHVLENKDDVWEIGSSANSRCLKLDYDVIDKLTNLINDT